jgi:uncharacterized protein (UPF0548 family)
MLDRVALSGRDARSHMSWPCARDAESLQSQLPSDTLSLGKMVLEVRKHVAEMRLQRRIVRLREQHGLYGLDCGTVKGQFVGDIGPIEIGARSRQEVFHERVVIRCRGEAF